MTTPIVSYDGINISIILYRGEKMMKHTFGVNDFVINSCPHGGLFTPIENVLDQAHDVLMYYIYIMNQALYGEPIVVNLESYNEARFLQREIKRVCL